MPAISFLLTVASFCSVFFEVLAAVTPPSRLPYSIPEEGSVVVFNCTADDGSRPLFWILPNGTKISAQSNGPVAFGSFRASSNQLIIEGVHKGMDGDYTCILEDSGRRMFFIPYIIANTDYSQSLLISVCVSLIFALACIAVLLFDRYWARSHAGSSRVADNSLPVARKQRIASEVEMM